MSAWMIRLNFRSSLPPHGKAATPITVDRSDQEKDRDPLVYY
jgi:hypothetical protein